ncbi:hypothetical protein [Methylobacterium sp. A54F]
MEPSPEFEEFGRRFIQDLDTVASNDEEIYNFVLKHFRGEERVRLRDFIDHALREASDSELLQLWGSVDADIYFPTAADLRAMLTGARDRL